MWKEQRSSETILRLEFEDGKYATGDGWGNIELLNDRTIQISGNSNYNSDQFVYTVI